MNLLVDLIPTFEKGERQTGRKEKEAAISPGERWLP